MTSPEVSTIILFIFYTVSTILAIFGTIGRNKKLKYGSCIFAVVAFLFQTILLINGFHKNFISGLSVGAYLQMLAWFIILCSIIATIKLKQILLLVFSAPVCLILFMISSPFLKLMINIPSTIKTSFYMFHIGSLYISLSLMLIAFISSISFLLIEKRIKHKARVKGVLADLPSISNLDKISYISTVLAFPFYTVGLLNGFFWSSSLFGSAISGDPKEIVSIFIWFCLAILFHNRIAKSWKGKKPAKLTILIFSLSLFSFIIVNTVMNSFHSFIR